MNEETPSHLKNTVKLCGQHDVTPSLELPSHESLLSVQLEMAMTWIRSSKKLTVEYDTLPLARSTKVSSERIIVTSALGWALPLNTVPVFFKSMVHVTVSLASLVT